MDEKRQPHAVVLRTRRTGDIPMPDGDGSASLVPMGFMDRLFSRHGSQAKVEAVLYEPRRPDPKTDPRPWDGLRKISVVGESNYQDALRRVSGAPAAGDWKFECDARLVPEPTNRHDPKAVMVQVDGECVGYLSRRNASIYGPRVRAIIEREGEAVCGAFIGRNGHSENPNLGVRLNAPKDSPLFQRLAKG